MQGKFGKHSWKVRTMMIIRAIFILLVVLMIVGGVCFYVKHRIYNSDVTSTTAMVVTPTAVPTPTIVPTPTPTPEPTATPQLEMSMEQVEECVEIIRGKYNEIVNNISLGAYREENYYDGVTSYWESDGSIVCSIADKGFNGSTYSKFIYYSEGKPFFAYYESDDSHRLYFKDGRLIRWRYCQNSMIPDEAVNYDLSNTEEYRNWEKTVTLDADNMSMMTY